MVCSLHEPAFVRQPDDAARNRRGDEENLGAAIDIEAPHGEIPGPLSGDPSHPAFYLPGQELQSGNIRAFATLTPCKTDGATCTSGLDCCGGFCVDGMCKAAPPGCSKIEDKCTTSADCCATMPPLVCIGGHCASPPIVK